MGILVNKNLMKETNPGIREMQQIDIARITAYWLQADPAFLSNMGVDLSKMPSKDQWEEMLTAQLSTPYHEKKSYCLIWLIDDKAVGHSNVNKIIFGEEAYMHLHIWDDEIRKKGIGTALVKMSLPLFFKNLNLKKIVCEPYALNPAPNRVLEKAGFEFIHSYVTIPGWINFEQQVNRWELRYEKFLLMNARQ
jgi:RimJ/RimL family protein N-acetyltransferase